MSRRGRRIDWWAIPDRFRDWQAMSPARKLLWFIKNAIVFILATAIFTGVITWYNTPAAFEAFLAGEGSPRPLIAWWFESVEHLILFAVINVAVLVSILLPKRRYSHRSRRRH